MKFKERIYYNTLKLIFLKAVHDFFPGASVVFEHTLSSGLFGRVEKATPLTDEDIKLIKIRMEQLIEKDYTINLISANVEDIRRKVKNIPREDIVRTVNSTAWIYIKEFELEGYHDYFYEKLYPSTGAIYLFDVIKYENGFILRYPLASNPKVLPEYIETPKLAAVQRDCTTWNRIMDVSYIGSLNEKILDGSFTELIRINETLHEVKLGEIALKIVSNRDIKVITVAGPSSSGKTTFSKRLSLHLKVHGVLPIVISLDNYYKGRDNIPLDEHGKKDFESIDGLDLELLNDNLMRLIAGEEVELPQYDFHSGERSKKGTLAKIPENGVVIIEGIHGLNERMTDAIPRENKFKIYVSCLTQLNIDKHNRIHTNEVRKLRRIVRDSLSRNTSAEGTLSMWDSVRRGEEKYIFKYQEDADAMFDSNLVYELAVLKPYAMKELVKIQIDSKYYEEAKRLIRFLYCFVDIDDNHVPDISLLKEFIGGSYFYDY